MIHRSHTAAWDARRDERSSDSGSGIRARDASSVRWIRAELRLQEFCEVASVPDGVVPVAVVHDHVHLLRLLSQFPNSRHPGNQLRALVEVAELLGGGNPLFFPGLLVAA